MHERNYCLEEVTENLQTSLRRSLQENRSAPVADSSRQRDAARAFWLVVATILTAATLVMGFLI